MPTWKQSPFITKTKAEVTIFAVNRHLRKRLPLEIDLRSFGDCRVIEHIVLENDDLKAANTMMRQDRVTPHTGGKRPYGRRQPDISDRSAKHRGT